MKKSVFFLVSLAIIISAGVEVKAQAPQSFNFQAVARNNADELMSETNLDVRLSLYAGSDASLVWQETHTAQTSDLGLFTVDMGTGTRMAGSAAQFSQIDWSGDTYSLKVEINPGSGWEDMGSSDLLSVPYALSAGSVSGLKSLEVNEDVANPSDSALFEVKNKYGNTVFAVYNEGVRVYVDDNLAKAGSKGGFAIGGFDRSKGNTFEFFRVTPDSIRFSMDVGATKGSKGGFAIGGFDRSKGWMGEIMHLSEDNYFIGYESGSNITTGLYNSFFGYNAGVLNTGGGSNVFIGNETGYSNTDGNWNIFMGNGSGYSNNIGDGNIILGDNAGSSNTSGSWNVFMGDLAGYSNTDGESNVYIGSDAGFSSTRANYNVFMGSTAGYSNTEGSSNVIIGESSGYYNTIGSGNVFMGNESGFMNDIGEYNVFIGEVAGWSNTSGNENVFLGSSTGESNTTGGYNVFIGTLTGQSNTQGIGNVFLGQESGQNNTTGSFNVALGALAGNSNATGVDNIFIGPNAGFNETGSNNLYIDNWGADWDQALIYGDFFFGELSFFADVYTAGNLYAATLNTVSDKSLKQNISDLSSVLDKVNMLRPVEYEWIPGAGVKGAEDSGRQTGLIAQDVELLFPDAISLNMKDKKAINLTYMSTIYLKALQEQQVIIESLSDENNILKERLNDLESKVNALIYK